LYEITSLKNLFIHVYNILLKWLEIYNGFDLGHYHQCQFVSIFKVEKQEELFTRGLFQGFFHT